MKLKTYPINIKKLNVNGKHDNKVEWFETLNLVLDFISKFFTILNVISTDNINVNKIRENKIEMTQISSDTSH